MAATDVIIVDTGALVSAIKRNEKYHEWAKFQLSSFTQPIVSCEAVLSESLFMLRPSVSARRDLMTLCTTGVVDIAFSLRDELDSVNKLIRKYSDVPMSLAAACLVRMCEITERSAVFTIDSDFRIYRKNDTARIPVIAPDGL